MKKILAIIIWGILVLIAGFALSEESDFAIVTFDKTELRGGDTISAHYDITKKGLRILLLGWEHHNPKDGTFFSYAENLSEMQGDISITASYNGYCIFVITCQDEEGKLYFYQSEKVIVHGITFKVFR